MGCTSIADLELRDGTDRRAWPVNRTARGEQLYSAGIPPKNWYLDLDSWWWYEMLSCDGVGLWVTLWPWIWYDLSMVREVTAPRVYRGLSKQQLGPVLASLLRAMLWGLLPAQLWSVFVTQSDIYCLITEKHEYKVEYSRTTESPQQALDPSCCILYTLSWFGWLDRCDWRSCLPNPSRWRIVLI